MIEKYSIEACYSFDLKGRNNVKSNRLIRKEENEKDAEVLFKILVEHVSSEVYELVIERLRNYGVTGLKPPMNPSKRKQEVV